MRIKLLNEHNLEFLSLKGGCTASSESTLVKMPHCWKSHVTAQLLNEHMYQCACTRDEQESRVGIRGNCER